eukprot:gnl/MRDRNA2_/MRDRNA2_129780_c0_seq1.p1 gnl/MRDRNA2_/MRDRNA2_129780_c0~~gnl/MRDRNA2_/MRDRNA2_129780_c0_seq1.p1  ORF type:complete len:513 (-),score=102.69 gnl/MRDRNA2_/MRDRNA2_129780_c0_seq1:74-1435(-)
MAATGYDPQVVRIAFENWLAAMGKESSPAISMAMPVATQCLKPVSGQEGWVDKVDKVLFVASSCQCRGLSSCLSVVLDTWWLFVCNGEAVRNRWSHLVARTLHWVAREVVWRRELDTSRVQRQRIESQIAATRASALGSLGAASKEVVGQKKAVRVDVRQIEKQAIEIEDALSKVREELERKQKLGKRGASGLKAQRDKKQKAERRIEELKIAIENLNCTTNRTVNALQEQQEEFVRREALARQELERCANAIEDCRARVFEAQASFLDAKKTSAGQEASVEEELVQKSVYQLNLRSPALLGSPSGRGDSLMLSSDLQTIGERSETDRSTATLLQDSRSALPSPIERHFTPLEQQPAVPDEPVWLSKTGYVVSQQMQQLPARSTMLPAPSMVSQSAPPPSMQRSSSDTSLNATLPARVLQSGGAGRLQRMQIGPLQSAQRQGNGPLQSFMRPS